MDIKDAKLAIKELKRSGLSDEDILNGFYRMYEDNKIDLKGLSGIVNLMGYEFSDEFKKTHQDELPLDDLTAVNLGYIFRIDSKWQPSDCVPDNRLDEVKEICKRHNELIDLMLKNSRKK